MAERTIGDYRILEHIGSGGMAKVYLAVHKDVPNLKVVLKVLSNSQHAERFMQEADKLALLDGNPNICKIRHFFNHGDEFVIAMEYIDGPSLEKNLQQKEKGPIPETLKTALDVISALEPAHQQGIYHRDIKPSNIMFTKRGQVKIIDFGIAKGKTDPQLTIVGTAAGTPEYMAPEQFEAREDLDYSKCDIYAVGTILYKMLTGELPFKGANEFLLRDSKLFETAVAPSKLNNEISRELDGIVLKSIESDPDKRFGSIAEMKAELQTVYDKYRKAAQETRTVETVTPAGKAGTAGVSKLVKALIVAVVVVAAAFALYIMIPRGDESGTPAVTGTPAATEAQEPHIATDIQKPVEPGSESTGNGKPVEKPAEKPADTKARTDQPARQPAPQPAPGELVVGSIPRNADIYIDGILQKEKTNFTFGLSPGRHSVKIALTLDGAKIDTVYTVTITSGEKNKILWKPTR